MATSTEKILGVALVATIIVAAVVGLLYATRKVSSHGKIKSVNCILWANAGRTVELTDIDWGTLDPGDVAGIGFWVQNTGNVNVTLSYNVTDWNPPSSSNYLMITWNWTVSTIVQPFATVPIQMQLMVSPTVTGFTDFSNNVTVTATEVLP